MEMKIAIAVRRDRRDQAPLNWKEMLFSVDGVISVCGSRKHATAIIEGKDSMEEILSRFGSFLRVETLEDFSALGKQHEVLDKDHDSQNAH